MGCGVENLEVSVWKNLCFLFVNAFPLVNFGHSALHITDISR